MVSAITVGAVAVSTPALAALTAGGGTVSVTGAAVISLTKPPASTTGGSSNNSGRQDAYTDDMFTPADRAAAAEAAAAALAASGAAGCPARATLTVTPGPLSSELALLLAAPTVAVTVVAGPRAVAGATAEDEAEAEAEEEEAAAAVLRRAAGALTFPNLNLSDTGRFDSGFNEFSCFSAFEHDASANDDTLDRAAAADAAASAEAERALFDRIRAAHGLVPTGSPTAENESARLGPPPLSAEAARLLYLFHLAARRTRGSGYALQQLSALLTTARACASLRGAAVAAVGDAATAIALAEERVAAVLALTGGAAVKGYLRARQRARDAEAAEAAEMGLPGSRRGRGVTDGPGLPTIIFGFVAGIHGTILQTHF